MGYSKGCVIGIDLAQQAVIAMNESTLQGHVSDEESFEIRRRAELILRNDANHLTKNYLETQIEEQIAEERNQTFMRLFKMVDLFHFLKDVVPNSQRERTREEIIRTNLNIIKYGVQVFEIEQKLQIRLEEFKTRWMRPIYHPMKSFVCNTKRKQLENITFYFK